MTERTLLYAKNLQRIIQKETISSAEEHDLTKFREFHGILKELFPNIFKVCEIKDFEGSLLLRWSGKDPSLGPVMFMNHHDVVEATGQWTHEPFSGDIAEERVWGRGTVDTKGGLWAMLQAGEELAAAGFVPQRDLYFESACTEETTGKGADMISRYLEEQGIHLEMSFDEGGMIMDDPIGGADGTFAMVGMGEKGCADIKFIAKSNGGHASTPGPDTPLVRLGKFMAEIEKKDPFKKEISPITEAMFRKLGPYMGTIGKVLGHPKLFGPLIKAVMPSVSSTAGAMLKTTLAFTMAKGSEGTNVLPQEAWVIGNMRYSHHQGLEGSLDAIRPIADKYQIEIQVPDPGQPSGLADINHRAFALVEEALMATRKDVDAAVPYVMTGASDSRYMDRICSDCIRFLPFKIDEQQLASIHGLNENIFISELEPAVDFYKYLMTHL